MLLGMADFCGSIAGWLWKCVLFYGFAIQKHTPRYRERRSHFLLPGQTANPVCKKIRRTWYFSLLSKKTLPEPFAGRWETSTT